MKTILSKPLLILLLLILASQALYAFYDPQTQRWINRDPVNETGFPGLRGSTEPATSRDEMNLYTFVANRPAGLVDPSGLAYGNPVPPCAPYPECLHHQPPTPQRPPTCQERENRCRARAIVICTAGSIVSGCGPLLGGGCPCSVP